MWGPEVTEQILLNGGSYQEGENLWQSLLHLRYDRHIQVLWVDDVVSIRTMSMSGATK
jgi:hypothetical protein